MTAIKAICRNARRVLPMLMLAVLTLLMTSAGKGAGITFSTLRHDFGTIREADGPVTYVFKFTNNGDAPLVIISADAACGCTKPKFDKEPVAPGKSGTISVKYLPAGRPGEFTKTIKVRTNAKGSKNVKLKITGTVIPAR